MAQEFDIALGALHGREGQTQDLEAQTIHQCHEIIQHHLVDLGIPDNALLAHVFLAGLELGLDQAQNLTGGLQQRLDGGQHDLEADEAHIDNGQIQRFSQIFRGHIADIGPLHDHNTLIGTDLPVQLTVAHIDGKDLFRALLQQAVGKAAGGSTGIGADVALRLHTEVPQCLFQLQTAPAHIGADRAADFNIHSLFKGGACLVRLLAVDIDIAAHDDGLCLGTGVGIEPFHQKHIQSLFNFHFLSTSCIYSATDLGSRPQCS